jgi:mono/diheme cytochrome c family protein
MCEASRNDRRQFVTKFNSCLATLLALAGAVDFGYAQAPGNPKEGLDLAQQVCSQCHATVAGQVRSPNPRAPRFPDLANTPGMTSTALLVALTTPHAGMPMFTLTGEQRDDVIAYILSLH